MKKNTRQKRLSYKRAIFSLPAPLLNRLSKYATIASGGNKSGFVAEAIEEKMDCIRKSAHTRELREAYKATAARGLCVTKEWEQADDELWLRLDELEARNK